MKNKRLQWYSARAGNWRPALGLVVVGVLAMLAFYIYQENDAGKPRSPFSARMKSRSGNGVFKGEGLVMLGGNLTLEDYDLLLKSPLIAGDNKADHLLTLSKETARHLNEVVHFLQQNTFGFPSSLEGESLLAMTHFRKEVGLLNSEISEKDAEKEEFRAIRAFLSTEIALWDNWIGESDESLRGAFRALDPRNPHFRTLTLGKIVELFGSFDKKVQATAEKREELIRFPPTEIISLQRDFFNRIADQLPQKAASAVTGPPNLAAVQSELAAAQAAAGTKSWPIAAEILYACRSQPLPTAAASLEAELSALKSAADVNDPDEKIFFTQLLAPRIELITQFLGVAEILRTEPKFAPSLLPPADLTPAEEAAWKRLAEAVADVGSCLKEEAQYPAHRGDGTAAEATIRFLRDRWEKLRTKYADDLPLAELRAYLTKCADDFLLLDIPNGGPSQRLIAETSRLPDGQENGHPLTPLRRSHVAVIYRCLLWLRRTHVVRSDDAKRLLEDAMGSGDPSEVSWAQWVAETKRALDDWATATRYDTIRRIRLTLRRAPEGWTGPNSPSPNITAETTDTLRYCAEFTEDDLTPELEKQLPAERWLTELKLFVSWKERVIKSQSPQRLCDLAADEKKVWQTLSRETGRFIKAYDRLYGALRGGSSATRDEGLLGRETLHLERCTAVKEDISVPTRLLIEEWEQLGLDKSCGESVAKHAVALRTALRGPDTGFGANEGKQARSAMLKTAAESASTSQGTAMNDGDQSIARIYEIRGNAARAYRALIQEQDQVFAPFESNSLRAPKSETKWEALFTEDVRRWQNLRREELNRQCDLEIYETAARELLGIRRGITWGPETPSEVKPAELNAKDIPLKAWGSGEDSWGGIHQRKLEALPCPPELADVWQAMLEEFKTVNAARTSLVEAKTKDRHEAIRAEFEKVLRAPVSEFCAYLAKIEMQRLDYMLNDHLYTIKAPIALERKKEMKSYFDQPDWAYVTINDMQEERSSFDNFEVPSYLENGHRYRAIVSCKWEHAVYAKVESMTLNSDIVFGWNLSSRLIFKIVKPDPRSLNDLKDTSYGTLSKVLNYCKAEIYDLHTDRVLNWGFNKKELLAHKFDRRERIKKDGILQDVALFESEGPNPRDSLPAVAHDLGLTGPEALGFPYPWPSGYTSIPITNTPKTPPNRVGLENLANELLKEAGHQ